MISNAPLERLLTAAMALDGLAAGNGHEWELRCLMRKIDWVATEAEFAVRRCTPSVPAALATPVRHGDAA